MLTQHCETLQFVSLFTAWPNLNFDLAPPTFQPILKNLNLLELITPTVLTNPSDMKVSAREKHIFDLCNFSHIMCRFIEWRGMSDAHYRPSLLPICQRAESTCSSGPRATPLRCTHGWRPRCVCGSAVEWLTTGLQSRTAPNTSKKKR